jgi:adenylate cyclase class 2
MARPRATNREIEIKLRITDLPALIRRLHRIAARPRARVFEENTLYDTPDADFRRLGRLLRLRRETSAPSSRQRGQCRRRTILTAKAPPHAPGSAKTATRRYKERLERERIVRDSRGWEAILRELGLRPGFRYAKYRTPYRLPGLHVDLDETPIGVFLELEGPRAAIDRTARTLGFAPRDYIQDTYWDIYAAECRRRGCSPGNMVFQA